MTTSDSLKKLKSFNNDVSDNEILINAKINTELLFTYFFLFRYTARRQKLKYSTHRGCEIVVKGSWLMKGLKDSGLGGEWKVFVGSKFQILDVLYTKDWLN